MVYDLMDTSCMEDGEPSNVAAGILSERFSPGSFLSNSLCWEMSLPELGNYRRGETYTDAYGLELLRRATCQDNQEAWAWVQHCFGGMVRGWLLRHPQRELACRLQSGEHYVAQTFERFWQAIAFHQQVEFSTLAAALKYLRASLNGVILDMLRTYARPGEVSLEVPGGPGVEDSTDSSEVWDSLKAILSNPREQRVAYLLFHCSLKPREIMRFCPQEWSDVQEIYRLRRTIMEQLLRNADHLNWRISERSCGSAVITRTKVKSKA
jgi:hypothetical protein